VAWDAAVPPTRAREGEHGGIADRGGTESEAAIERERLGTAAMARWECRFRRFATTNVRTAALKCCSRTVLRRIVGDSHQSALIPVRRLPHYSPSRGCFEMVSCDPRATRHWGQRGRRRCDGRSAAESPASCMASRIGGGPYEREAISLRENGAARRANGASIAGGQSSQ
jgi:hypothetical protein